jgi:trans-2-enoyl-CoA reductase
MINNQTHRKKHPINPSDLTILLKMMKSTGQKAAKPSTASSKRNLTNKVHKIAKKMTKKTTKKTIQKKSFSTATTATTTTTTTTTTPKPVRIISAMYEATGAPQEVMHLQEQTIQNPEGLLPDTKVFVKCLASPINPADINLIEGTYGIPSKPPAIAGNEGVFQVICTGPQSNLKKGDWVVPVFPAYGTWRSHIIGDSMDFLKVPNDVTSALNVATLMVNPCTAWRMLEDFVPLTEGDYVIQNGANSSVGRAVIQLTKYMRVNSINIIRARDDPAATQALIDELTSIGATHVITDVQMKDRTFIKEFLEKTKIPQQAVAKLGINCVSGTSIADLSRFMAPGGTVVTYGGMSKKPAMIGTGSFIFSDLTYKGFWMSRWNQQHGPSDPKRISMLSKLMVLLGQGNFSQKHDVHVIKDSVDLIKAIDTAMKPQKEAKVVLDFSHFTNDTH